MEWRAACTTIAQTMFDVLSRHKNLAPLLVHQIPSGPNAMRLRELAIAVLLDNGFPPPLAGRSYATLAHYVLGFAMQLGGPDTAAASPPTGLADVDPAQVSGHRRRRCIAAGGPRGRVHLRPGTPHQRTRLDPPRLIAQEAPGVPAAHKTRVADELMSRR
jgi:hypothetical protein